ncbi:MAG: hypothetical protein M1823_003259 [Watsoniomyces obsoletus]|nr:MAG: hypothetical protein M1823_003259 [Watsoniomyces obsoletus]
MSSPLPTSSGTPSRTGTPTVNPAITSNFTAQSSTAEDLLKSQTVGLVHLSDFRKRRAEALEQKEREAESRSLGRFAAGRTNTSGSATPSGDGASTPYAPPKKKKRKAALGKLSFGVDEEEDMTESKDEGISGRHQSPAASNDRPASEDRTISPTRQTSPPESNNGAAAAALKKRLGANSAVGVTPKVLTKSTLLREAQMREQLRKEFLAMQKSVRATEMVIPFVFYDGTNIPGGACKVKKGDHVWLFLDKARKVGAEKGVGGAGERASSKREWARVGVDDLLLVRGEIIIPHHYEFYFFIVNKTPNPSGGLLFDYSSQPTLHSPNPDQLDSEGQPINIPSSSSSSLHPTESYSISNPEPHKPTTKSSKQRPPNGTEVPDTKAAATPLEGTNDDPTITKVVDRRWYERNKHIFPASVWEEFDPEKDYGRVIRRDTGGNAFFFT